MVGVVDTVYIKVIEFCHLVKGASGHNRVARGDGTHWTIETNLLP